jgi:pilus assembly protein CpaC
LAEPNLVTLNGQTASFQAGGQFPVPQITGFTAAGLQGVAFVPFGVQLAFTPIVTDKDRIRLTVSAEVSTRDLATAQTVINGAGVPSLQTRNFQTTVELREGQTLAVAGLIQNNLGADSPRVPFFGDLPLVGPLFGVSHTSAGEQEIVVLITPELVHPLEPHEVPPLPGSDIFEPGDLEFYLLARLESRRYEDYRSPVRTDKIHKMCFPKTWLIHGGALVAGLLANGYAPAQSCPTCNGGAAVAGMEGMPPGRYFVSARQVRCPTMPPGAIPLPPGSHVRAFQDAQSAKAEADDFVFSKHE